MKRTCNSHSHSLDFAASTSAANIGKYAPQAKVSTFQSMWWRSLSATGNDYHSGVCPS